MPEHLLAAHVHKARYIQTSDPGAVGTGVEWLDTNFTPAKHKKRDAANTGWDEILDPSDYALLAGATFTGDVVVPAEVYGVGWNGSNEAPTKNDVYDKIETILAGGYTDEQAQDAVGAMVDASLVYVDATPLLTRAALTGDVTASAGSNATTIVNDAVTDGKLRDSAALSVIGRSANSSGDPADIAAGADKDVLRRSGTSIGFGTIDAAAVGSGVFVDARLASSNDAGNSGAADTIDWSLGRSQKSTLTDNVTYTFSNPVEGATYVLRVHTGAGSFTATWPGTVKWPSGTAPTVTTAASKLDVFTFHYDGSIYIGVVSGQNYTP